MAFCVNCKMYSDESTYRNLCIHCFINIHKVEFKTI